MYIWSYTAGRLFLSFHI